MNRVLLLMLCLFIGISTSWAQSRVLTGVVSSAEDGSSIPGASVVVDGTTVGTVTDFDGNFQLKVPEGAKKIKISYVGMKSQLLEIGDKRAFKVKLKVDAVVTEDVVVTAMGIKKSAKSLTYAVSEVGGDEVALKSEPDAIKGLQGKVAGVQISGSQSIAGSPTRIVIRGNSSFTGNNQPLIVVDGIPFSNDQDTGQRDASPVGLGVLASIDPNNIKSQTVLKGAAASALYGSRASNGVIIITTKSGASRSGQKFVTTVSSSYSVEKIASLPDFQNTYGNGADFKAANYWGSWGARFSDVDKLAFSDAWAKAYPDKYTTEMPYEPQPNNVENMLRNGSLWDNSVNITGGGEKTSMSLTISDSRQSSYIPESHFNRTSISLGVNAQLAKKFKVSTNFQYAYMDKRSPFEGNTGAFRYFLYTGRSWDTSLPYEGPNGENLYFKTTDNPQWSFRHNYGQEDQHRIVASVKPQWDITDYLTLSYQFSVNQLIRRTKNVTEVSSNVLDDKLGDLDMYDRFNREMEGTAMLNFRKNITDKFSLRVTLGQVFNVRNFNRLRAYGSPYIIPGIYQLNNIKDTTGKSRETEQRLASVFGEVSIGYNNYLTLSATSRMDWSSTLPKDNNNYLYPSLSASYVFSDALGLKSSLFNSGLIRASWAKVGSDAGVYDINQTYNVNYGNNGNVGGIRYTGFPFNGTSMMAPNYSVSDTNLKPEFTSEFEIGTNLEFFNSRIVLDAAYYSRSSTDQIMNVSIPDESGYYSYLTNVGEMTNKGVELSLDLTPIKSKDFSWSIFTVFSKNTNEVVKLIDGLTETNTRNLYSNGIHSYIKEGLPYGVFKGYGAARDDQGNILIDQKTGLMIKSKEESILGDPNPDYLVGITNTFRYKRLSLRAVVNATCGGEMYTTVVPQLLGRGVTKDTEDRERNHVIPGVIGDTNTGKPILDMNGNTIPNRIQVTSNSYYFDTGGMGSGAFDEFKVYDATVYRLSELSLSYNIPDAWVKALGFNSATFGVLANNLLYFAPGFPEHSNFDPEVNSFASGNTQGMSFNTAPSLRRFSFNLKFSF
ncbi:SusC/RagA family TonB-linked outer membrane protein [Halosquirtibacter xylanolyticus]|uniref:SusC/RagA family TonB-linked outer membrane protein n=1 Tax=Halosquirtibacter xylanolyticus TaxID=3374599 RepID=UPI00374981C7|nr:SusC/RagA family TonB-linked outer membrane protein [Prolixibacteraceae bacterium]